MKYAVVLAMTFFLLGVAGETNGAPAKGKIWKNMNRLERAEYKVDETKVLLEKAQKNHDSAKEHLKKVREEEVEKAKKILDNAKTKYEAAKSLLVEEAVNDSTKKEAAKE